METKNRSKATERTKKRYNRVSTIYDLMDRVAVHDWMRKKAVGLARGNVLEAGVGTGLNLPLYPKECTLTGIDLSPGMLQKARARAESLNLQVRLLEMDIQQMDFPDNHFDTVLSSCVFCSVPDPVAGLREVGRVCKRDGQVILLEHMRSDMPGMGPLMDLLNPVAVRTFGENINRRTIQNIEQAGLIIQQEEHLKADIFRLIVAAPG